MYPRGERDSATWTILRLLDDTELLEQEGLLWPGLFARECRDRGLPVSEDELEYYERRGWLAPLLRIPQAKQWFKPRGDGFMDEVEVPEGAEPEANLVYRYGSYETTGTNLISLRDEGLISDPRIQPFHLWREQRDPKTHEETVSTYYVLWLRERVELDERWRRVEPDGAFEAIGRGSCEAALARM